MSGKHRESVNFEGIKVFVLFQTITSPSWTLFISPPLYIYDISPPTSHRTLTFIIKVLSTFGIQTNQPNLKKREDNGGFLFVSLSLHLSFSFYLCMLLVSFIGNHNRYSFIFCLTPLEFYVQEEEHQFSRWEGYVNWRNKPALRGNHGGMLAASFVLGQCKKVSITHSLIFLFKSYHMIHVFQFTRKYLKCVCVSICVEKVFPLKVYIFVYILLKEKNHLVLLVVVEILENLAFLANASNLVLYLRKYMHFSPSKSANNVTNFMGTAFLLALLGGFLSDAFFTTYNIYLISAVIELLVSYTLNFQTLLFHIHTYFSHRNSLC